MYEALRAYFIDELPSAEVAHAFNYSQDPSKFFAITSAAMPTPTSLSPHALDRAPSPRSPPLAI